MLLTQLTLSNFRNFSEFQHEFSQSISLIAGPNGSGKSNLLESIYLLAYGTSPRTQKDNELIRWGSQFARVSGSVKPDSHQVGTQLEVILQKSQKKLLVNQKNKNLADFLGNFQCVLFSPSDLVLLEGSPRRRRKFLDGLLSSFNREYLLNLLEYKKTLLQRNQLLVKPSLAFSELEFWDQKLSELASFILQKRLSVVKNLNELLQADDLQIEYLPSPRSLLDSLSGSLKLIQKEFDARLKTLRQKEQALGFTLIGPQRDDWKMKQRLDKGVIDLGIFGSRGEQRMAIVKLKIAQLSILKQKVMITPVLLLDDVLSELDQKNQKEISQTLNTIQTLITSTQDLQKMLPDLDPKSAEIISLS